MGGIAIRLALWALGALGLAACGLPGESGLEAELARVKSVGGFAILSKDRHLADIAAEGRRVRLKPVKGLCVAPASVDITASGAFAIIGDCVPEGPDAASPGAEVPPTFPGLLTVTVAGNRGFGEAEISPEAIEALKTSLATPQGRAFLGRGGAPEAVTILEMRQVGDALYVLVEDPSGDGFEVFSPQFWRAFARINDRLVLTTLNGLADIPIGRERMLAYLAMQVSELRRANRARIHRDELALAEGAGVDFDGAEITPTANAITLEETGQAPERAPRPRPRLGQG